MRRTRPVAGLLGLDGPSVEVPGWAAAWLEQHTNLATKRVACRGVDPGIDDVLAKLHYVAVHHLAGSGQGSADGTETDTAALIEESSTLTVTEAAAQLGITDRAVRKAIAAGRLKAKRSGAVWLIDTHDINVYKRKATAA